MYEFGPLPMTTALEIAWHMRNPCGSTPEGREEIRQNYISMARNFAERNPSARDFLLNAIGEYERPNIYNP